MDRDAMILEALSKLGDKVDETKQTVHDIDKSLAEQRIEFKTHKEQFDQHMVDHTRDHSSSVVEHSRMNDLLDVHIKATRALEEKDEEKTKKIEDLDKRVKDTETPIKFSKTFVKVMAALGTLAGATIAIMKLMDLF